MNETNREYLKRINFVLDFIEKNLDADLSLEYLAEKAHYSPFHFHRVFSTVVNERLNEFINRKRIERIASILLVGSNITLKDLAYRYGFQSDNSFSRAFKNYYGISPTKFKSEGKEILSKIGIEPFSSEKYICSIENIKQWIKMNAQVSIKELQGLKLACISHIGEFDKASSMFQKLMEWGHNKGVLDKSNFKAITIYHDNPNVTQTSKVRFSAGVTVSKSFKADGEIREISLPKGVYAVGHFEIKGEDISRAWKSMCVWIIENGCEFRDGDYFEIYHNDKRNHPEQKFILDICIPLESIGSFNLGETRHVDFIGNKEKEHQSDKSLNYHELIAYMNELKRYFHKEYDNHYKLGSIYKGNPDYSYFSLTTEELKKQKLKFVIILNHKMMQFEICLSGQNKSIRKRYWQMFRGSDWSKYHLAESINDSLSIIDHTIVERPDFTNKESLTEKIEKESIKFMNDIIAMLN